MKMLLDQDGSLNAIGSINYPLEAPAFIIMSGHTRWKFNGGDINNQSNWDEIPDPNPENIKEIDIP